ncbi:MAG TPA: hypothetical protein VMR25_06135, partial [Planctomycetaceae bacterium]|nr:hypothetical protein [Planctomycetaceae bacterium]
HWLRHDLGSLWDDLTSPATVRSRGWFSADGLRQIRTQSQSGRADHYMLQWAVLTLELWAREFLDRNPADLVSAPRGRRAADRSELVCKAA